MGRLSGRILKQIFPISADQFEQLAGERYGFQQDMADVWRGFEPVARTLVEGFHAALDYGGTPQLAAALDAAPAELRGIIYEGAGMGLTLLDALFPWQRRLNGFLAGHGVRYLGLVYIGAGLVLPRMPVSPNRFIAELDPVLRWLVLDGYGFYQGFFAGQRYVVEKAIPIELSPYGRRAFDHGLGRSIWFSTGANPRRIADTIDAFPAGRRADLWAGIGLACAYAAGIVDRAAIETLRDLAGPHHAELAVGAAVAARLRLQSGHQAPHTELACETLWGRSSADVAHITALAMQDLPTYSAQPAYEIWRRRIAQAFAEPTVAPEHEREMAI